MASPSLKKRLLSLAAEANPQAELDSPLFLAAAAPVLKQLEADLLKRADASAALTKALKARHAQEKAQDRTADGFPQWRRHFVDQVAAAWLLSCVFVRTLEDRGLVEQRRLAGPGALDSERQFRQLAPSLSERDYLLWVFRELTHFPAARDLFDQRHNPVWLLAPSADAAKALLDLFRSADAEAPAFRFGQADSRFLGDLYQDLNDGVKKRFALLQTPRFVERFILERTLGPSIERFGLEETSLIDPTCGSGHFLLGGFEQLFDAWLVKSPNLDVRQAAAKALNQVYGSDINPYAVAIARLRLTLAFLDKAKFTRLRDAPALDVHVVVADSLLYNPQLEQTKFEDLEDQTASDWNHELSFEDPAAARKVLGRQFTCVVGNPPYIVANDAVRNKRYREMYSTAHKQYQLCVPFTERFFQLARHQGLVGLITSNGFMKREFGGRFVRDYLPTINLTLIVNTEGAFIPGHGTPTVLLFGSAETAKGTHVLTVLATRGEPGTPKLPHQGKVWSSVEDHWEQVGFENDYITVAMVDRPWLERHPWILAGGGVIELVKLIEERSAGSLKQVVDAIGRTTVAGEDDVWIASAETWSRRGLGDSSLPLVTGEVVRDWSIQNAPHIVYPYSSRGGETVKPSHPLLRTLWPWRTLLSNRTVFGKRMRLVGRPWWEHLEHYTDKLQTPLSITFAFVATHNHFVLDRGGKVFNRSAPIIKLPTESTEEDHLALLAYLNSSLAMFWMRQCFSPKTMGNASTANATPYLVRFEFDGTKLKKLPLPPDFQAHKAALAEFGRRLDDSAVLRCSILPQWDAEDLKASLSQTIQGRESCLKAQVGLQEELDWFVYHIFGIVDDDLAGKMELPPSIGLGERPFEHSLARDDDYFKWHQTSRSGQVPPQLTTQQAFLWQCRGKVLSGPLKLLESPECKRRWVQPAGKAAKSLETDNKVVHDILSRAFRTELETAAISCLVNGVSTSSSLETEVLRSPRFRALESILECATDASAGAKSIQKVLEADSVPYLASQRFSENGLEKHSEWQAIWELQRQEDGGGDGKIPVPPKYVDSDFRDKASLHHRGKLDVPKERFISYPGCESDTNGEPVYGWAGWNHEQRAIALAELYTNRRDQEGWTKERLTPLLAGLLELLPWLQQWHGEVNPEFGQSAADEFSAFLEAECRKWGLTHDDLRAWRPATKAATKRAAKASSAKAAKPKAAKSKAAKSKAEPKAAKDKTAKDKAAQPKKPRGKAKATAAPAAEASAAAAPPPPNPELFTD